VNGERIRPEELAALYKFDSPAPPRAAVFLIDDVLTTGCNFRAAKDVIQRTWPGTAVLVAETSPGRRKHGRYGGSSSHG
jgi:hypothetical protein